MLLFSQALLLITVSNVSIVQNTTPFFTVITSAIYLRESMSKEKFICCFGCLLGITIIIDPSLVFFWTKNADAFLFDLTFLIGNGLILWWSVNRSLINVLLKKGWLTSRQF